MAYLLELLGFPQFKFYSSDNLFPLSFSQFFVGAEKSNWLIWKYSSVQLVRPVCVVENLSSAAKGGRTKIEKNMINISEFFVQSEHERRKPRYFRKLSSNCSRNCFRRTEIFRKWILRKLSAQNGIESRETENLKALFKKKRAI